ncbi:unnamed protein product, partial [Gongylonema pulchrum]|uniref:Nonstructural protein n=1 Tax=Gongylonema pulchrum TaxID=637853 RepID=A0A183EDD0_9BILA
DDTHSLVSESWSTDVLPSDTEGFGTDARQEPDGPTGAAAAAAAPAPPLLPVVAEVGEPRNESRPIRFGSQRSTGGSIGASLSVGGNGEDRSDTWSVDAMASDSEADPILRADDILMIDEADSAYVASATSGGTDTPMLASVDSSSSMAVGGSAASQAAVRSGVSHQGEAGRAETTQFQRTSRFVFCAKLHTICEGTSSKLLIYLLLGA